MIYVVVAAGDTFTDPFSGTGPIPLSMLIVSALILLHVKVAEPPGCMVCGSALKVISGWGTTTVTTAWAVAVPLKPVAVMVYVVVTIGDTEIEPLDATSPMPLSILMVSASVELQVNVLDSPVITDCGSATRLTVGGGTTVTITCAVFVPPLPVAVIVYVVVAEGVTSKEPLTETVPIPLSMETMSVCELVQLNNDVPPGEICWGTALKSMAGAGKTLTVVCPLIVPPGPVAVIV